jgi:anti-sigma factor ChrR (cupin superfamily)
MSANQSRAFTPYVKEHEGLEPLASRTVRPSALEWEEIRYPGCKVKTLLVDPDTGLLTVLLKMEPGAELPDHEHVLIEQTYVLEGKLVDKDGPDKGLEVGPGEFVWRPAGSRHSAWTPEGALMIAVFQVPNKFFEKDGRVVDLVGNDWDTRWGKTLERAQQ